MLMVIVPGCFLLQVVDYKKDKFAEVYKEDPFDIVVDCMGQC
jgi:hypothetical protein